MIRGHHRGSLSARAGSKGTGNRGCTLWWRWRRWAQGLGARPLAQEQGKHCRRGVDGELGELLKRLAPREIDGVARWEAIPTLIDRNLRHPLSSTFCRQIRRIFTAYYGNAGSRACAHRIVARAHAVSGNLPAHRARPTAQPARDIPATQPRRAEARPPLYYRKTAGGAVP